MLCHSVVFLEIFYGFSQICWAKIHCGARGFVTLAHFTLGPKTRAEEGNSRGPTVKVQVALRRGRGWLYPRHPQGTPKRKG